MRDLAYNIAERFGVFMNEPYAEVDLLALKNNAIILKRACEPASFYAVVKADAYGHGLIQTARAISNVADGFCAGTVAEGVALRLAGVEKPVLCLIPPSFNEIYRASAYGLEICVQSVSALKSLANFAKNKTAPRFHLAVNTGMNRLGVSPSEISAAKKIIKEANLPLVGAFSHFYNALNYSAARAQYNAFAPAIALKNEFGGIKLHISSGAGLRYGNEFKLDIVRVGLALYGYNYGCDYGGDCTSACRDGENLHRESEKLKSCRFCLKGLRTALKIYAPILQTRRVFSGSGLLYGNYVCKNTQKINVLSYGYYHGLSKKVKGGLNKPCMNISAAKFYGDSRSAGVACVMDNAQTAAFSEGISVYNVLTRASSLKKAYLNGYKSGKNF